jgi:hypothetical protein
MMGLRGEACDDVHEHPLRPLLMAKLEPVSWAVEAVVRFVYSTTVFTWLAIYVL